MKALAEYIHSKKLKAGIYTDAGQNTCESMWNKDSNGVGSGVYGHISPDCDQVFLQWGFDFLKVDWCGGEKMKLDEDAEYTRIIHAVKAIDTNMYLTFAAGSSPANGLLIWLTRGGYQAILIRRLLPF